MECFTDYKYAVGARVRSLRDEANMSLREFGLMCGVHHNQLLRIEGGKANPTLETLHKIASALDMSVGELLDDEKLKL